MSARIRFPCPACQRPVQVPAGFAGRQGGCPRCRTQVVVPPASQPLPSALDQTQATPRVRPCPSCGEQLREQARKCRFCGDYLDASLRQRKPGEGNYRLGSPWDRLLAYLADLAFVCGPPLLLVPVAAALEPDLGGLATLLGLGYALLAACLLWYLVAQNGASLGKRWRGLTIVREDGQPADFVHGVVLREWVPLGIVFVGSTFYVLGCAFLVLDKLFVLGDDRRCLHDMLASTRVVETAHQRLQAPSPADQVR